jgi:transcriptional regulator with XRE-family HTH domain
MSDFGEVLRRWRERARLSQLALARLSGVHASIINRFEGGERQPAERAMVERLAEALALATGERDQLLATAGFFPETLARLGAADADLLLIAGILADETIAVAERQELRLLLRIVARRWRPLLPVEGAQS